jgi:hypothetical protein
MADPTEIRMTRRAALTGLGAASGIAVAGLATGWETAQAGSPAPDAAGGDRRMLLREMPQVDPVVPTPGLRYVSYGMFAFQPNLASNGFSVSSTGCYCSTLAGYVVTGVDLPSGATIKEVAFTGRNSSSGSVGFFLERYLTKGAGNEQFAVLSMPAGAAGLQSVAIAVDHLVDPEYTYDVGVFTSTSIRMWNCRIGYVEPPGPPLPPSLYPLTPQTRKLDTREAGPLTGKFNVGDTRVLSLAPQLPAGASAALLNVTVAQTEGSGFLSLYPGSTWPGTSTINWSTPNQTIANNAIVAVTADRTVTIRCGGPAGSRTHVVVDLVAYLL